MSIPELLRQQAAELRKQAAAELEPVCVLGHCAVQLLEKAADDGSVEALAAGMTANFLTKAAEYAGVEEVEELVACVQGMQKTAYSKEDRDQFRAYVADQLARADAHSLLVRGHQAKYTDGPLPAVGTAVSALTGAGAAEELVRMAAPSAPRGVAAVAGAVGGTLLSRHLQRAHRDASLPDSRVAADKAMLSDEGRGLVDAARRTRGEETSHIPDVVVDRALDGASLRKMAEEDVCLRLVRGEISEQQAQDVLAALNAMGEKL